MDPPSTGSETGGRRRHDRRVRATQPLGLFVYLEEAKRVSPLAPRQQRRLFGRIRRGDRRALDKVALSHLGLVAEQVERQWRRGIDVLAVLDEGNRALLNAILTFGGGSEDDFRGYARSHIATAIGRALAEKPCAPQRRAQ
jgi:DNA-directed RNA polymerase sigma subunit (sigma70/sigma32)